MKNVIYTILKIILTILYCVVFLHSWPFLVLLFIGRKTYAEQKKGSLKKTTSSTTLRSNLKLSAYAFLFIIALAEIGLRLRGGQLAWLDDNYTTFDRLLYTNYSFVDQYLIKHELGHLRIYKDPPGTQLQDCKPEFCHSVTVNNEGCNDRDWSIKKTKKKRVICIGDSYTEGVGAHHDSSFVALWQHMDTTKEFMNWGIRGADPFFEYMLLKNKILKYQPDLVVMSINNSDYFDAINLGGFDRFLTDGTVAREKKPWWYPAYGYCYIVRLTVHTLLQVNYNMMTPTQEQVARKKAIQNLNAVVDSAASLCKTNHIALFFNFHPIAFEFTGQDSMELQPVMKYAQQRGLNVLDMRQYFLTQGINATNAQQLYWPVDGHHRNIGYELIAKGLKEYTGKQEKSD